MCFNVNWKDYLWWVQPFKIIVKAFSVHWFALLQDGRRQIPLQDKYPSKTNSPASPDSFIWYSCLSSMLVTELVFSRALQKHWSFHTAKCSIEIRLVPNKHKVNKVPSLFQQTQILSDRKWVKMNASCSQWPLIVFVSLLGTVWIYKKQLSNCTSGQ